MCCRLASIRISEKRTEAALQKRGLKRLLASCGQHRMKRNSQLFVGFYTEMQGIEFADVTACV
jgi:hypothetical protein